MFNNREPFGRDLLQRFLNMGRDSISGQVTHQKDLSGSLKKEQPNLGYLRGNMKRLNKYTSYRVQLKEARQET